MLFLSAVAWAGESTDDYLTIAPSFPSTIVVPGSDDVYTFIVKMNNVSRHYTAVNMDIHLPSGLEVQTNSNGKLLLSIDTSDDSMVTDESGDNYHILGATFGVVGDGVLRVAITSINNDEMKQQDGNLFSFKVKATAYLKPGDLPVAIDNIAFIIKEDAKAYEPNNQPDATFTVGTESSLTLNISSDNKWSTCILPFDCALPAGVEAYTCDEATEDYIRLTPATSIVGYKPCILYAKNGYSGEVAGNVTADNYLEVVTDGLLHGAIVPQQITSGYVLQKPGDDPAQFYNVNGQTFTIPSGRCWVETPSNEARELGITIGTTGITQRTSAPNTKDAICYDLQGRRVDHPQVGRIYIIGGQKVLKIK